jgi:hypothetical protein
VAKTLDIKKIDVLKTLKIFKYSLCPYGHRSFGRDTLNPFPAYVAIKRHLGSAPKSHFCDLTGKTEVIGLSDLMDLFIDLGCLY